MLGATGARWKRAKRRFARFQRGHWGALEACEAALRTLPAGSLGRAGSVRSGAAHASSGATAARWKRASRASRREAKGDHMRPDERRNAGKGSSGTGQQRRRDERTPSGPNSALEGPKRPPAARGTRILQVGARFAPPRARRAATRGISGTDQRSRSDRGDAFRAELGPETPETAAHGTRGANSAGRSPFRHPPSAPCEPRGRQARK